MDDRPWCAPPPSRWADADVTAGRQPRARDTRRSLLLAASRLIDSEGYHGASLNDVARAAGSTKGAVYFHFSSKRALAEALLAEASASWDDVVARTVDRGDDPLRTVLTCYDAYIARLLYDPISRATVRVSAETDVARQVCWTPRWEKTSTELLARARDRGDLVARVHPARLSRHLLATSFGHFALVARSAGARGLWDRMNDMWEGLLPMIAGEDWLAGWRRSGWAERPLPQPDGGASPTSPAAAAAPRRSPAGG